jgi:hypothetical protein
MKLLDGGISVLQVGKVDYYYSTCHCSPCTLEEKENVLYIRD